MNTPLNTILYGPPGTGKTYTTLINALSIIEEVDVDSLRNEEYEKLKSRYDDYVSKGRIVFTAFHPSMSYENFVEGVHIKPPHNLGEMARFEVKDGIFKSICKSANPANGNFAEVIESFKNEISEPDEKKPITINAESTTFDIIYRGSSEFFVKPYKSPKNKPWHPVKIEHIEKVFTTGNTQKVYNLSYINEIINYLKSNKGLKKYDSNLEKCKNYVIIIDEINRGNMPAIFGELISLLDPGKRSGADEALSITLPYSKKHFTVPSNLYVIGTMSTTDHGIKSIDSTMRRRFSFIEIKPQPELIISPPNLGVELSELLSVINNRIEVLLDKDHLIGHSYFMKVNNLQDLKNVFVNEIVPLLREYFIDDLSKISLILGEGFCKGKPVSTTFANQTYDPSILDEKHIFSFNHFNDDQEFLDAIDLLFNKD